MHMWLWERWLAREGHFGVLVAGEARGEAPPPEVVESEISLGCPGDAFGSENEAASWLGERLSHRAAEVPQGL
jgi:hypothetical protein